MKTKISSHWPLTILSSLSSLANLSLPLVLVRVLSPEEMGHYKVFFLYLGLMPWLTLSAGINNGLYHWSAKERASRYFQSSWTLLLGWSVLVSLLLAGALFIEKQSVLLAFGSFLVLLAGFHDDALVSLGRMWKGAFFTAFFEVFRTALVVGAALKTGQLRLVIAAYLAGLALKLAVGVYFGWKSGIQKLALPPSEYRNECRAVLRYAVPVSFASLIAVVTHYADQLVVSKLGTAAYFAGYSLGCLSIPPLNSFEQAVNRVMIPGLAQSHGKGDSASSAAIFRESVAELAWLLIPATAGLMVFAGPIVRLLFTDRYAGVAIFLRLYALSYLLLAFPYDAWARARGESRWILKNLAISFGLALVVIPALGAEFLGVGAIAGLLVTQLSLRVGGWRHIRRTTNWNLRDFFPVAEIAYDLMLVGILTGFSFLMTPLLGKGLSWFLACGPAFALIYLGLTLRRRFKGERLAVLQVTQYLETGGLERVIYSLCQGLKGSVEVSVFSYDQRQDARSLAQEFEKAGITVHALRKGRGFSLKAVFAILKICQREKISVLHTHDLGPLVYACVAKALTLGALRIVHTQHSFIHLSKKSRYRIYERFFTRLCDELVVVSEDARQTYAALGVPIGRIRLIPNGVFFPEVSLAGSEEKLALREALSKTIPEVPKVLHADRVWVLYLARIHPKKGQNHAIAVWNLLPEKTRANAVLVFVGQESFEGEVARLQFLGYSVPAPANIVFAGVTREPERWIQASDLFLSLSEFEGMPLGPMEAYGAGMPLVLSKIPGHEILADEISADDASWVDLPVTEAASRALEARIERAASEAFVERAERFARRMAWREAHGVQAMAGKYLKLYERTRA